MPDNPAAVSIAISIVGTLISLGMFLILWRKLRPETAVLQGDALDKYNDALNKSAARELQSQTRWDQREADFQTREAYLMGRLSTLEAKYSELDGKLAAALARAERFERYAYRLAGQVTSMGGTPVPLEIEAR